MPELAGIPHSLAFMLGSVLCGLGIGIFIMGLYLVALSLGGLSK